MTQTSQSQAPKIQETPDALNMTGIGYHFSAMPIAKLTADGFCLAQAAVDVSSSMDGEEQNLANCFQQAIKACEKAPNHDAILFRVTEFNHNVKELRGFLPPESATPLKFTTGGATTLAGSAIDALRSMETYAEQLSIQGDYSANGILFLLTDGEDTVDGNDTAAAKIKTEADRLRKGEKLSSIVMILVGFRPDPATKAAQEKFALEAGMKYLPLADATPQRMAKFAEFVSQSVSSQSRQVGTSQPANIVVPPLGI